MTVRTTLTPPVERIVLIGAGRNANNLIGLFEGVGLAVAAVLDDAPAGPVLGHAVRPITREEVQHKPAILTVASPLARRALATREALGEAIWITYVDPRAVVSSYAEFGPGVFIAPFAACADVIVGRHASIMAGVVLGARVRIGDYCSVLPGATIASDAIVGEGSTIGMGARVEAGVHIGAHCRVAPNAVVRRHMPDHSLAASRLTARLFRRRGDAPD